MGGFEVCDRNGTGVEDKTDSAMESTQEDKMDDEYKHEDNRDEYEGNKVEYKRGFKTDNGKMFEMPGGYSFRPDRIQVREERRIKISGAASGEQPMQIGDRRKAATGKPADA